MIENDFRFHPVGQGLFYSGTLDGGKFNFVYDCGTMDDRHFIEKQIDLLAQKLPIGPHGKPILDFVAISHFHADHYNALPYLLKKFDVSKFYLPYISNVPQIMDIVFGYYIFCVGDEPLSQKILLFETMRRIYSETFIESSEEGEFIERLISCCHDAWRFCFLQKKIIDVKKDILFHCLEENGPTESIISEIRNGDEGALKKLAGIYKKVFGDVNLTSMIMLHFPLLRATYYIGACNFLQNDLCAHGHGFSTCPGFVSLLTGDARLDKALISRIFAHCADPSGVIQIPHHGSYRNYFNKTNNIASLFSCFSMQVISFGLGNRYNHPSREVVKDISLNKRILFPVTQATGLRYRIQ